MNLYPFEATAARPDLTVEELIENIDIGGPAMVRSAAKNFESVAVVTDPADYPALAKELAEHGDWSLATRLALAQKAFAATARYDGMIATELERLTVSGEGDARRAAAVSGALAYRALAARGAALRRKSAPESGAVHSRGQRPRDSPARSNCRARSFPTTIWWTWTRRGVWRRSLSGPPP